VRIERQQSRRSEEQRFDGMRRQPFAQNGFVGYAPRQRKVGFLILTVAQRAEVKQVEGLVPVLRRFVPQRLHHAHFAFEPVEEQRRAYLAALQGRLPREESAAGVSPGSGPKPVHRALFPLRRHAKTD